MTLRHPVNFHIWQWTAPILSSQSVLVDEEALFLRLSLERKLGRALSLQARDRQLQLELGRRGAL